MAYCLLIYRIVSSIHIYCAPYYVNIYTAGACLSHGLYTLEGLTHLVTGVANYVHAPYIQFIVCQVRMNLLSLQGHLPLHIHIQSHSNFNLCPKFYLNTYLHCTEPFRKRLDGFQQTSRFLVNNRQHMPVCAKIISSWVRKVLSMAQTHISKHSPGCCGFCSFGGWSFLSVHPAGRWLGQILYSSLTLFQHISLLHISTRILSRMLSWVLVSSQLVVKCQSLTYIKFCTYVRTKLFPVPSVQFSNCLCRSNTRQLELLLWRERPDSPTSSSQCLPKWLSWTRGSMIPCNIQSHGWGIYIRWQHLTF